MAKVTRASMEAAKIRKQYEAAEQVVAAAGVLDSALLALVKVGGSASIGCLDSDGDEFSESLWFDDSMGIRLTLATMATVPDMPGRPFLPNDESESEGVPEEVDDDE